MDTPPGTKISLSNVRVVRGKFLLEPTTCKVLGGVVPVLVSSWAANRVSRERQSSENTTLTVFIFCGYKKVSPHPSHHVVHLSCGWQDMVKQHRAGIPKGENGPPAFESFQVGRYVNSSTAVHSETIIPA